MPEPYLKILRKVMWEIKVHYKIEGKTMALFLRVGGPPKVLPPEETYYRIHLGCHACQGRDWFQALQQPRQERSRASEGRLFLLDMLHLIMLLAKRINHPP